MGRPYCFVKEALLSKVDDRAVELRNKTVFMDKPIG